MAHLCAPFEITPMRDKRTQNIGVITTAETKENGVLLLQNALSTGTILRANRNFSVGTTAWRKDKELSDDQRFELRVGELHGQASRFRKVIKSAADVFGLEKVCYSGKDGVHQDDLIMVMIIAVYFIQRCINESR